MEEKFIIQGGVPLRGEIEVRGSKNAASKLMIASLLTKEPCTLENVPLSGDIDITRELCENVGSTFNFYGDHSCTIETRMVRTSSVPELSRKNRISVLALGPLLHRKGFAEVPVLGGCPIGHRPINLHVEALNRMGVRIERREHSYYAESSGIHGADIEFPYPSVGATENVILTAVLADGKTIIRNAAVEPEIFDLIRMLRSMGAEIDFDETLRCITIQGVAELRGVTHRVLEDRNEIVSFASAALATDGDIFIRNIEERNLLAFLEKIKEIGGTHVCEKDGIRFSGRRPYRATTIETSPHPLFMTDWQQPFCVLLTQAKGQSIIHETVYEDRFGYTKDLGRMGADIVVSDTCPEGRTCRFLGMHYNHSVVIKGSTNLHGAEVTMPDIRAGMAHIVAALAADGESVISGVEHVDRGYEKIDERLRMLGAEIKRV